MLKQIYKIDLLTKLALGLIVVLTLQFSFSQKSWAGGSLQFTTYYPTPQGSYDRLLILPQATLPSSCKIGELNVEQTSGKLFYCNDTGTGATWNLLSNVWAQAGTYIYPSQTDSKPLLFSSIGTTTPSFKLTLDNDGGILALGTFGNGVITTYPKNSVNKSATATARFMWYPRRAAFRAIWDRWGVTDDTQIGDYSVAFGDSPTATGVASTVSGLWNTVSGNYGTIAGGANNLVSGNYSTITGGENNIASGQYSVVSGYANHASGDYNTLAGGLNHTTDGDGQTIGGGNGNSISAEAKYSTIAGGKSNIISHSQTAITGNDVFDTSDYSVISGGESNSVNRGAYSIIGGGSGNVTKGAYVYIGGGYLNNSYSEPVVLPYTAYGHYSVVVGGRNNTAQGDWSVVSGGLINTTSSSYSTILGGRNNTISGTSSLIAGGSANTVSGSNSVIAGGDQNTIGSNYSWAGGRHMALLATYTARTFVWGYSDTDTTITTPNAFIIAPGVDGGAAVNPKLGINETAPSGILSITLPSGAPTDLLAITSTNAATPGDIFIIKNNGNIGIGQTNPSSPLQFGAQANGAYLTLGGVWTSTSSRSFKENIRSLNAQKAVNILKNLQPVTYNYKVDKTEHHVGFIAEDVPDLVAAEGRKSLNPMPVTAVLTTVLKKQKQDIAEGQNEIKILKEELNAIEQKIRMNSKNF